MRKRRLFDAGYQWVAEADGLAHAVPLRGAERRICDEHEFRLRFTGHPVAVRCGACVAALVSMTKEVPTARHA